jgi:hypothetical protein
MDTNTYSELVGKQLFIRTVTYHLIGRVRAVKGSFVELEDASWVADSGRFGALLKDGQWGSSAEVERVGEAWVNLDSVTDMFPWGHELPQATR